MRRNAIRLPGPPAGVSAKDWAELGAALRPAVSKGDLHGAACVAQAFAQMHAATSGYDVQLEEQRLRTAADQLAVEMYYSIPTAAKGETHAATRSVPRRNARKLPGPPKGVSAKDWAELQAALRPLIDKLDPEGVVDVCQAFGAVHGAAADVAARKLAVAIYGATHVRANAVPGCNHRFPVDGCPSCLRFVRTCDGSHKPVKRPNGKRKPAKRSRANVDLKARLKSAWKALSAPGDAEKQKYVRKVLDDLDKLGVACTAAGDYRAAFRKYGDEGGVGLDKSYVLAKRIADEWHGHFAAEKALRDRYARESARSLTTARANKRKPAKRVKARRNINRAINLAPPKGVTASAWARLYEDLQPLVRAGVVKNRAAIEGCLDRFVYAHGYDWGESGRDEPAIMPALRELVDTIARDEEAIVADAARGVWRTNRAKRAKARRNAADLRKLSIRELQDLTNAGSPAVAAAARAERDRRAKRYVAGWDASLQISRRLRTAGVPARMAQQYDGDDPQPARMPRPNVSQAALSLVPERTPAGYRRAAVSRMQAISAAPPELQPPLIEELNTILHAARADLTTQKYVPIELEVRQIAQSGPQVRAPRENAPRKAPAKRKPRTKARANDHLTDRRQQWAYAADVRHALGAQVNQIMAQAKVLERELYAPKPELDIPSTYALAEQLDDTYRLSEQGYLPAKLARPRR